MERKLASIQRIVDIQPIPNADAIEVLTVLGWKVVARKGEFKVGDLVVYFEVDSILKESPEIEFLRKSNFRIKTIKLRGQVSQGLCLPVHRTLAEKYFPLCEQLGTSPVPEGTDVTELLGVVKYEPYVPAQLAGVVKGNFPEFLHKTDEIRIQSIPELLEKHKDKKFYVTEKIDGSSMTVFLNNNEFGVCSRNLELKETESNSFWKIARKLDLEKKMRKIPFPINPLFTNLYNFALQGELIGQGIQENKYKLSGLEFRLFNIFNIDTGSYLGYEEFKDAIEKLGLESVPLLEINYILPKTVEELVEYSKGKSVLNKDVYREGIVLRPLIEEYDKDLRGRLSFKCINPDFLLKYNE